MTAIVVSAASDFRFSSQYGGYRRIRNLTLMSLEAKHIVSPDCNKSKDVLARAVSAGHKWCVIGSHREDACICQEILRIQGMCLDLAFNRPMRVVITSDQRVWCDNTHTAIAYACRIGRQCRVRDVPHYLVDFRYCTPLITSVDSSVHDSVKHIQAAISAAKRLDDRLVLGYRPKTLSWSILDLTDQLNDYQHSCMCGTRENVQAV